MAQQFAGTPQVKTRIALVIFLKCSAAPIALYTENPQADYQELQQLLKTSSTKFFERENMLGPVKKICVPLNQIAATALQEEQYV